MKERSVAELPGIYEEKQARRAQHARECIQDSGCAYAVVGDAQKDCSDRAGSRRTATPSPARTGCVVRAGDRGTSSCMRGGVGPQHRSNVDGRVSEDSLCVAPGWIKKTDYLQQNFRETLRRFAEQRAVLVTRLRKVNSSGWTRGATFTGTTLGRDDTVLSYATRIADHEVRHLDQLRRTLKS